MLNQQKYQSAINPAYKDLSHLEEIDKNSGVVGMSKFKDQREMEEDSEVSLNKANNLAITKIQTAHFNDNFDYEDGQKIENANESEIE